MAMRFWGQNSVDQRTTRKERIRRRPSLEPLEGKLLLTTNLTLAPVAPLGGLVYDASASDTLSSSTAVNSYNLTISAHQTLALVVTPVTSTLSASVTLLSPTNQVVGKATSASPGAPAVLPGVQSSGGGTYQIEVSGGTGQYNLVPYVGAYVDPLSFSGGTNNTIASATSLDPYATSIPGTSSSRVAVLGAERTGDTNPVYSFSLTAGETASTWVAGLNNQNPSLTLLDSSGAVVAQSYAGSASHTQGIDGFTAPSSGRYFVRVNGGVGAQFNLVVSMGAAFTALNHTSPATHLTSPKQATPSDTCRAVARPISTCFR